MVSSALQLVNDFNSCRVLPESQKDVELETHRIDSNLLGEQSDTFRVAIWVPSCTDSRFM